MRKDFNKHVFTTEEMIKAMGFDNLNAQMYVKINLAFLFGVATQRNYTPLTTQKDAIKSVRTELLKAVAIKQPSESMKEKIKIAGSTLMKQCGRHNQWTECETYIFWENSYVPFAELSGSCASIGDAILVYRPECNKPDLALTALGVLALTNFVNDR